MNFFTNSNIIPLFENVSKALLPAAKSSKVDLNFSAFTDQFKMLHNPALIIKDFTELLCNIMVYTPESSGLEVFVKRESNHAFLLKVEIICSGANLSGISEITASLKSKFKISTPTSNSTLFELFIENNQILSEETLKTNKVNNYGIPSYYSEIRRRLKSHFSSVESIEKAAIKKSQAHGVFIQNINALIQKNIDQENFKIETICHHMALSRTQLYRKLKSLINMSPARYVLYFRLQKAKELLQDTNLNVGEVSVKTGFASHSHFTRSFIAQFGISPSQMKNENIIEQ